MSKGGGGGTWCLGGGSDTIPWQLVVVLRRGRVVALGVWVATLDWSPLVMVVGGGVFWWGLVEGGGWTTHTNLFVAGGGGFWRVRSGCWLWVVTV